jgi:polyribonucleotide nucleotidyltransferase
MKPTPIVQSIQLRDGREITLETGVLAKQASGSVVLRMGNTMLLATVVANKNHKEGTDFLPLSVDYQEKFASNGKIPGGFLKREGRLSDYEILVSRLVDRALRPIFPEDFHAEIQVNIQMISADFDALPDALAGLAASSAIMVSDVPFNGPISEVRVIKKGGKLIVNPSSKEVENAELELIVAGTGKDILMVEGEMNEVSEDEMLEAIIFAHDEIKIQCQAQVEFMKKAGKEAKFAYNHETHDLELKAQMTEALYAKVYEVAKAGLANKSERKERFAAIVAEYVSGLEAEFAASKSSLISKYYHDIEKDAMRNAVMDERIRLDGRKTDQVRPIWTEVDYLPSAHGSAIFSRGETQSLTTVTLGTKLDEQMIDSAMRSGYNKFMLHYNFPGFSTGEVKPNRGPGRREVGHGNLALRALKKVLPNQDENPYTIRVVSDILESNGSSSMATVCAGSLSLMDAGINISSPVAGIAMGLIADTSTSRYAILSDILGDEDHLGDMDFKVAGTAKGITATQMDLKVDGLKYETVKEALEQARRGRLHILGEMAKTLDNPKPDLKPSAPRVVALKIERDMIGAVIGPGGKVVQEIQRQTGATINIEETPEGGLVSIFAVNKDVLDAAVKWVSGIVAVPTVGDVYDGKVKSIQPFGAFVEFMPGKEGLLHISEIKWERLPDMEGVLEIGEEVKVKLIEVDKKSGKYRLSRKVLLPREPRNDREGRPDSRDPEKAPATAE